MLPTTSCTKCMKRKSGVNEREGRGTHEGEDEPATRVGSIFISLLPKP